MWYNYIGREKRCGQCDKCKAVDSGKCHFCLDKKKFGRLGRLKKCCIQRQCKNLIASSGIKRHTQKLKADTMSKGGKREVLASIETTIDNLSKQFEFAW